MTTGHVHHLASTTSSRSAEQALIRARTGRRRRPAAWPAADGGDLCRFRVYSGLGLVTVGHPWQSPDDPCGRAVVAAFRAALGMRLDQVIVDLDGTGAGAGVARALAGMAAVARRHGVQLWLTGVSPDELGADDAQLLGTSLRLVPDLREALHGAWILSHRRRPDSPGRVAPSPIAPPRPRPGTPEAGARTA